MRLFPGGRRPGRSAGARRAARLPHHGPLGGAVLRELRQRRDPPDHQSDPRLPRDPAGRLRERTDPVAARHADRRDPRSGSPPRRHGRPGGRTTHRDAHRGRLVRPRAVPAPGPDREGHLRTGRDGHRRERPAAGFPARAKGQGWPHGYRRRSPVDGADGDRVARRDAGRRLRGAGRDQRRRRLVRRDRGHGRGPAGRPGPEAPHRLHLRPAGRSRRGALAGRRSLRRELVRDPERRPHPRQPGRRDPVGTLRRPARRVRCRGCRRPDPDRHHLRDPPPGVALGRPAQLRRRQVPGGGLRPRGRRIPVARRPRRLRHPDFGRHGPACRRRSPLGGDLPADMAALGLTREDLAPDRPALASARQTGGV